MSTKLTKVDSHISRSKVADEKYDQDEYMQSIFIKNDDNTCSPIMECEQSLMNILANYKLNNTMLYLLLDNEDINKRDEIEAEAKKMFYEYIK